MTINNPLAVITPYFPPVIGGAENQLRIIIKDIARQSINVDLYTSSVPGGPESIPFVKVIPCSPAIGDCSRWRQDLLQNLVNSGTTYACAIVLLSSVCPPAAVQAAKYLASRNVRVVLRLSSEGRFRELPQSDRTILSQIADFVVHSELEANTLIQGGIPPSRVHVVFNVVNEEFLQVDLPDVKHHHLGRRILFVGRLDPKKRLDLLLDAWGIAEKLFPFARLRIVGSDKWEIWKGKEPLRSTLSLKLENLGLKHIEFVPESTPERLINEYLSADVAVNPSGNEGMSNFILEAMAMGLPVVCSDIGANSFVVDGQNGWKFRSGDVTSLAHAITRALSAKSEHLSRIGDKNTTWVRGNSSPAMPSSPYLKILNPEEENSKRANR